VLVELIYRRTGVDYRTFIRERIAGPMGLDELFVGLPPEHDGRVADVRYVSEPVEPPGPGDRFEVGSPFPNPLRIGEGVITFPYTVPESAVQEGRELVFEIYDVAGRRLVRQRIPQGGAGGRSLVTWDGRVADGRPAASGAYLFVFQLDDDVRSGRVMIVR
jgi:CubicO group peptidase (beta-lactamase class C family)